MHSREWTTTWAVLLVAAAQVGCSAPRDRDGSSGPAAGDTATLPQTTEAAFNPCGREIATSQPRVVDAPYPYPHTLPTQTPILPDQAVFTGTTPVEIADKFVESERAAGEDITSVVRAEWVCPQDAARFEMSEEQVTYQSPWDVAIVLEGGFRWTFPGSYIGTPSTYRYVSYVVDPYSGGVGSVLDHRDQGLLW